MLFFLWYTTSHWNYFGQKDTMGLCKHIIYLTPAQETRLCWLLYPNGKELFLTQVKGVAHIQIISQRFSLYTLSTFMGLIRACLSSPHGYSLLISQEHPTNFTLIPDFSRGVNTVNLVLGASTMTICLTTDIIEMMLQAEPILRSLFRNPHIHSRSTECGCDEANTFLVTPCASAKWPINYESLWLK